MLLNEMNQYMFFWLAQILWKGKKNTLWGYRTCCIYNAPFIFKESEKEQLKCIP